MFWNDEFTRFRNAKTKRVRRLYHMSAFTHPTRTYPSAWTEYSAKVLLFSDICKFGKQNLLFYAKICPIRRIGQIGRKAYGEVDRSSAEHEKRKSNKRKRSKKKITKRKGIGIILFNVYTPHYNLPSQHWILYPFHFLYKKN